MLSKSFVLLSLMALASASPMAAYSNMVVHNSREAVPAGFKQTGAPSSEATFDLRIAMTSNNVAGLEKALYDVSTPGSSNYGKFLSKEQVEAFVKPAQETQDAVNAWLAANDLKATAISPAGDWIKVTMPVSKANKMLSANYQTFTHTGTNTQGMRTLSYSIPSELKGHIDTVHPATSFDFAKFQGPKVLDAHFSSNSTTIPKRAANADCSTVNPACLQGLYGIPTAGATQQSNQIAVSGFGGQFAQTADLSSFLSQFRSGDSQSFTVQPVDGGQNTQGTPGVEANLDVQYTVGIATNVPNNFVTVGTQNSDGIDGFMDIVSFLGGESTVPNVLTTSYGFNEQDLDQTTATNLCNAYMQLGARGTSILFASGDGGVCGVQSTSGTKFIPTFPSTCPFVTSVGGTVGTGPETGVNFSGGGFSNYFTTPDYQSSQVSSYLSSIGGTNQGLFNPQGRGFPDVAAQAQNVVIVNGGQNTGVAGTSCASPIFASVVALINDQLIAAGKAPLGFLNPFVYANGGALTDITSGNNPGCGTNGFNAAAGWDPVTGMGTPNFGALTSAAGL